MRSATEVRREAVARLIELAGADGYDPDVVSGHAQAREILRRRVLRRHGHDIAVMAEMDRLWPLARGDAGALIDAVNEPDGHPGRAPAANGPDATLADLEDALARAFAGGT